MKRFRLLLLLTALMSMVGGRAMAYDAEVNGIYYNFSWTNAEVTNGDELYTGSVVIPETVMYNGTAYTVTRIGTNAFKDCSSLTSVTIGSSIEEIYNAFEGCSSLAEVNYNATYCVVIGNYSNPAFKDCPSLTTLSIGNNVQSIPAKAFSGCSSLKNFDIPNSVTSIGDYAFEGCSGLTSVTIPNSVTSIGKYVFQDCSGLKSVTIGNSLTSISTGAFESCFNLASVSFGNSVTSICDYAFSYCYGLTSIDIPNSVTSIDSHAFRGCSSLTSIFIPKSVTSIGASYDTGGNLSFFYNPFAGCSSLTSIQVASDNKKYDTRNDCNAIIETASNILVTGCQNTVIPNTVTSIGSRAFYGSRLTSIYIPNTVTSIGDGAFKDCSGLTSITVMWETPIEIGYGWSIFENPRNITLYVPYGCKNAYLATDFWCYFNIEEMSSEQLIN